MKLKGNDTLKAALEKLEKNIPLSSEQVTLVAQYLGNTSYLGYGGEGDGDDAGYPTVEMLQEWEADGGCEATDGCWVETDGTWPHGCKSWMIVMGLI